MNTITINVNGTILNLTVKRGATVSVTVVDEAEVKEETDNISEITLHEEPPLNDSDSAYDYVELCKPASKVHTYARDADGNYICPYCNITKKKCNTMSEHVRHKHSSEYGRNTDMYACKYENCKMTFAVKPGLDQHILNCHSEKIYYMPVSRLRPQQCKKLFDDCITLCPKSYGL